jgi:hypothetical protein
MSLDGLKPSPSMDTVRFESEPPGAEAKTSTGQTCRTPCALALPVSAPLTVSFSLNGYQTETETVEPISAIGSPTQLRPNPVTVELTPAPPQPAKRPVAKKTRPAGAKAAPKAPARPKPAAAAPAPAGSAAAPASPAPQAAPWPAPAR